MGCVFFLSERKLYQRKAHEQRIRFEKKNKCVIRMVEPARHGTLRSRHEFHQPHWLPVGLIDDSSATASRVATQFGLTFQAIDG